MGGNKKKKRKDKPTSRLDRKFTKNQKQVGKKRVFLVLLMTFGAISFVIYSVFQN